MRLNEEQLKTINSLKNAPSFYAFAGMLEDERDVIIAGLTSAKLEQVQVLQGKLQLITELIKMFNKE